MALYNLYYIFVITTYFSIFNATKSSIEDNQI